MHFIAHRGNTHGPNKERENTPKYIDQALSQGFQVEVDIWMQDGQLYLGHDAPETPIAPHFLFMRNVSLWCHAKNLAAFEFLLVNGLHCFYHDKDAYTLTSRAVIWAYPGQECGSSAVCVMPERCDQTHAQDLWGCAGICSDYIAKYKTHILQSS